MPRVFSEKGYYFFFFSSDKGEPPHIHARCEKRMAKIWLNPIRLAKNIGLKKHELRHALKMVNEHEKEIKNAWQRFFKK